MKLQATPLDLLHVIEQKRARDHMMGGLRPPGAPQGKADYSVPGASPNPPVASEQSTNGENEAENEQGEQLRLPYHMSLDLIGGFV